MDAAVWRPERRALVLGVALALALVGGAAAPTRGADDAQGPASASTVRPRLFAPFLADPKEPHFYAAGLRTRVEADGRLETRASVGLGDEFVMWSRRGAPSEWQAGLQAGATAQFLLVGASSYPMLNGDYLVGGFLAWRRDRTSARLRLYHQSSHLGDEYMVLNPGVQPINSSFEDLEGIVAHDVAGGRGRVYAGGGFLIHRRPSSMARGKLLAGAEWRGRTRSWSSSDGGFGSRLVGGVDLDLIEELDWKPNVRATLGMELTHGRGSRSVGLLAEYYHGSLPFGQFLHERLDHLGLGIHLGL